MAGEWREVALWDIAEYINGRATKPSELSPDGVPVIKIAELNRGITGETDRIPPDLVGQKHWVNPGDLLFAWSGSVGVYRYDGPKAALNQHIFRVVAKPGVDQRFLQYLLLSCMPVFALRVQDKRTTMGHVTRKDLEHLKVYLPSLPEQRAIAHILGTLDDKIELNRRMSETLEAMARALFKAWFVDFEPVRAKMEGRWRRGQSLPGLPAHLYDLFSDRLVDSELGEIPEGWEVGMLDDFAVLNPEAWSKDTAPDQIEYVDLSNTKWGRIESTTKYLWENAPSRAQRVLRTGDTIVGTVRPANGSYALITEEGLTGSTGFAVLRPRKPEFREFIYLAATAPDNIERLAHLADGAAYPAVRPDVVATTQVVRSPHTAIEGFSNIAGPLLDKIAGNDHESRTLAALRDALLPKLITGELRVKDTRRDLERSAL